MEDDYARAEATFRFTVQNLKNLTDEVVSPTFYVRNLPWRIMVEPRPRSLSGQQQQKGLAFFLQCNVEDKSPGWSCNATAELRLIPQKPDTEPVIEKIQHLFNRNENDWGYSRFMAWDNVLNPNKGYIKDNAITLEVHCVADMPHGVSSVPKKPIGCADDVTSITTDKISDDNLVKVPNGETVKSEDIEIEETTPSDMTETQGTSAENNSDLKQETEHAKTEDTLVPATQSTEATVNSNCTITSASLTTSGHQSTEQQQNISNDNSIIDVLQRVENILSSLLKATQQKHTETGKDEFYYFALSVAAQLRILPAHIAADTLNKIQSTLSTARLTSIISNTPASTSSHT